MQQALGRVVQQLMNRHNHRVSLAYLILGHRHGSHSVISITSSRRGWVNGKKGDVTVAIGHQPLRSSDTSVLLHNPNPKTLERLSANAPGLSPSTARARPKVASLPGARAALNESKLAKDRNGRGPKCPDT